MHRGSPPDEHTEVVHMKIGFIGAGKVGTSLGKLFAHHGVSVTGYYSRTPQHAEQAAAFTQSNCYSSLADILDASDTLFVTTPDGVIGRIWDDLAALPIKSKCICHCSGALPSAVFASAEKCGARVCSVHPLLAVSDRFSSWQQLEGAFFTLEGSGAPEMAELLHSCGAQTATIAAADKARYHLAACVVSNLAVGLSHWGMQLLEQCGFTAEQAQTALTPLILGNAQAVCSKGPRDALTGPAERGDVETIRSHMACLSREDQALYALLTRKLCDLAQQKHPDRDDTALRTYLEGLL
ncbi:MAG TPA: DUF2520 domain-containing protein [Clostridiales bacterium]|nr:DUF2520 domain-containing protein [Clostridiales bacterium]